MNDKTVLHFEVFGRPMSVMRTNDEWLLFNEPAMPMRATGMRTRVYDVVIPSDLTSTQLASYLADIYHEYASDKHPKVIAM